MAVFEMLDLGQGGDRHVKRFDVFAAVLEALFDHEAGAQHVGVQPAPPLSAEAIRQQSLTPAAAPTPSFE